MKAVFYFDFYQSEEDSSTYYGFNMELTPDSVLITESDDSSDSFCYYIESDYGVHDWSSRPNDAVAGIGYTTYEVMPNKYDELMNKWRAYFKSRPDVKKITEVVRLDDPNIDQLNDLGIYELVEGNI